MAKAADAKDDRHKDEKDKGILDHAATCLARIPVMKLSNQRRCGVEFGFVIFHVPIRRIADLVTFRVLGSPGNENKEVKVPWAVTCSETTLFVPVGQIPLTQSTVPIVPALSQLHTQLLVTFKLANGCPLF
jgi:hypothetical protein